MKVKIDAKTHAVIITAEFYGWSYHISTDECVNFSNEIKEQIMEQVENRINYIQRDGNFAGELIEYAGEEASGVEAYWSGWAEVK